MAVWCEKLVRVIAGLLPAEAGGDLQMEVGRMRAEAGAGAARQTREDLGGCQAAAAQDDRVEMHTKFVGTLAQFGSSEQNV